MSTLTVNRQRKAQRIANVFAAAIENNLADERTDQAFVLAWLDSLPWNIWTAATVVLGYDDAPSPECKAIVRTILEERYSPDDAFAGLS